MKNRIFATLSSLTLLTTAAAFAQGNPALEADIPFAFHIGEQTLPAGEYSIARGRDPSVLSISDRKGHAMVTLVMQAVRWRTNRN